MTINGNGFSTRKTVQIRVTERSYQVIRELKEREPYNISTAHLVDGLLMEWLSGHNRDLWEAYRSPEEEYDSSSS